MSQHTPIGTKIAKKKTSKKTTKPETNPNNLKENLVENSTPTLTAILDGNPNSESAQKFELELCWCIQQLQNGLKNEKLNQKQVEANTMALNTLMSNKAPIVKKRQIMRLTFGDYRSKMMEEEKKFQSVSQKLIVKPVEEDNKKSQFIKKATIVSSGNEFRFNFPEVLSSPGEATANVVQQMSKVEIQNDLSKNQDEFHFVPSDNSFKFNFNTNKDTNS